jgi:hypothetical protein
LRRSLFLLPVQIQILDFARRIAVTIARRVLVVEVLVPRSHAADVQREHRLQHVAASLQVIAHHHANERCGVECTARLVRLCETFRDPRLEVIRLFGIEPEREEAIGQLRAECDRLVLQARGVDRNAPFGVQDGLERFTQPSRISAFVGQIVVIALVGHRRLARCNLLHDLDVLTQTRERLRVRRAVPTFDNLWPRRA